MIEAVLPLEGSSCVVTGGAGFIGSHLVDALACAGARVVAVDNLQSGRWTNIDSKERVQQVPGDIAVMDRTDFERVFASADYLFHLAAEKHNASRHDPDRVIDVNVKGTLRLFDAAAAAGVRKIIFTSSLYAAGRMSLPPMRESDLPEPKTVYGISKLAGEHLLHHFDVPAAAFRLFFTYGPRQFAGSGYKSVIVSNFERILRGEPPVIRGDGTQALDYVHVDDVVRGLIMGLSDRANGHVINLGSGQAVTINELTSAMLEVARSPLRPSYAPPDWTAGTHRVCDNEKVRAMLGWTPEISLREGLAHVHSWMKAHS